MRLHEIINLLVFNAVKNQASKSIAKLHFLQDFTKPENQKSHIN